MSQGWPMKPSVALAYGPSCCSLVQSSKVPEHSDFSFLVVGLGKSTDGVDLLFQYHLLW